MNLNELQRYSSTCRRGQVCETAVRQSGIVGSSNKLAGKKSVYLEIQEIA